MGGPVGHFSGSLPTWTFPPASPAAPLQHDDAHAVFEVMAAQEAADLDEVMIEEADIVGDWAHPSFDIQLVARSASSTATAWSPTARSGRPAGATRPSTRRTAAEVSARPSRGWMQANAREREIPEIGMPVPLGSPGDRLLEALGYRVRWESWGLELPAGATVPVRDLPEGYVVRQADPSDYEQSGTSRRTPSSSGRCASGTPSTTGWPA